MFPSCWLWLLLISFGYCCESCSLSLDSIIVTTAVPTWLCCPAVLLLLTLFHSSKDHFAVVFSCSYVWLPLSQSLARANAGFSLKEALLSYNNLRFLTLSVRVKICLISCVIQEHLLVTKKMLWSNSSFPYAKLFPIGRDLLVFLMFPSFLKF